MHILILLLLCGVQIIFASNEPGITEYEYANRKLLELIFQNSITAETAPHPGGANLKEIEEHLAQWGNQIDFSYNAHPYVFKDNNALQLACYNDHASDKVVILLCQYGADPNHRKKGFLPAAHCMENLFNEEDSKQDLREYNKRKILALKAAAVAGKQKLHLDAFVKRKLADYNATDESDKQYIQEYNELLNDTVFVEKNKNQ